MKLNKQFLVHNTGRETILVPSGEAEFSGVVRGGRTFGVLLELLNKGDSTEEELAAAMRARFDAPEGVIEQDIAQTLGELRKIGALDE